MILPTGIVVSFIPQRPTIFISVINNMSTDWARLEKELNDIMGSSKKSVLSLVVTHIIYDMLLHIASR